MLLNNRCVNENIKRKNKKLLEANENGKFNIPKPTGHSGSRSKGKFTAMKGYISKEERPQIRKGNIVP